MTVIKYLVGDEGRALLACAGIIFSLGGFTWLAKNHFHTMGKRLDTIDIHLGRIEKKLDSYQSRISNIEGFCEGQHKRG